MKKKLSLLILFAPLISSNEVINARAKNELDQTEVASKRQKAMQEIFLKSFDGLDQEVLKKCVKDWSNNRKCQELRSFLTQYLVIEDICRQTIEESINQAKDQFLVESEEAQA